MQLDILYATVSGNAEAVAKRLEELAKEDGYVTSLNELNFHTVETFKDLKNIAIITSTYGEGDVPEMGLDFWEEFKDTNNKLTNMKYGLIALGDRSHEIFCGAGKKISKKLDELEATKVIDNLECDGDTNGSEEWSVKFLTKLKAFGNIKK